MPKFTPERPNLRGAGYVELATELRELSAYLRSMEDAYNGRSLNAFRSCGRGVSVCEELRERLLQWDRDARAQQAPSSVKAPTGNMPVPYKED